MNFWKAWSALHKIDTVWKLELSDGLKIGFFRATIKMVLLYGSMAWTLTQSLDKKLDRIWPDGSTLQMRCLMEDYLGSQPQLERGTLGSAVIVGGVKMKLLAIWFCGNRSMATGVTEDKLAVCESAGGGNRGPQRLLAGSDGWQGWLEKESWKGGWGGGGGELIEVDLVVVVVSKSR